VKGACAVERFSCVPPSVFVQSASVRACGQAKSPPLSFFSRPPIAAREQCEIVVASGAILLANAAGSYFRSMGAAPKSMLQRQQSARTAFSS